MNRGIPFSKNELVYVVLAMFNCFCWDSKIDEITYIFRKTIKGQIPFGKTFAVEMTIPQLLGDWLATQP
jgi:hypothetical protein